MGGTGALTMATFHPDRYRFAGSLSGFLTPSNTYINGAITAGLAQFGGVDTRNMWGLPQLGRWKWHDPDVHAQLLVDNNTRLWVFSPSTTTCTDVPAMIGYCDQAQGSNRTFYQHYRSIGGGNGHFDFPTLGQSRLGHVERAAGRDVRGAGHDHPVGPGDPLHAPGTLEDVQHGSRSARAGVAGLSLLVASWRPGWPDARSATT